MRELSLKIGKNKNYIRNIENYKGFPFITDIRDICDCLDYSIYTFFNEECEKYYLIKVINEVFFRDYEQRLLRLLYLIKNK